MSFPRVLIVGSLCIFGLIGSIALFKHVRGDKEIVEENKTEIVQEVCAEKPNLPQEKKSEIPQQSSLPSDVDKIDKLFVLDSSRLPLVETITYSSRVPWLKGRPAWLSDYASYYQTTRHFIARGLNKGIDYFTQKVSPGDRFNVIKKGIQFYLLVDLEDCRMWFYSIDTNTNERLLLKTYFVGIGRKDSQKASKFLTPTGIYSLGSKVAIYKPGTMGYFQDHKVEMVKIFGTRWIPFADEVSNCSERAKGYGIHGAPWVMDGERGQLSENGETIGKHESDGCIRLSAKDMEELFAIVVSRPTKIELVHHVSESKLPGVEKEPSQP